MKHWILGWGSIGCLFDGMIIYDTKTNALRDIRLALGDEFDRLPRGIVSDLKRYGVHYVRHTGQDSYDDARATYQVVELYECDCDDPDNHCWY